MRPSRAHAHRRGWIAKVVVSVVYTTLIVTLCVLFARPGAASPSSSSSSGYDPAMIISPVYIPPSLAGSTSRATPSSPSSSSSSYARSSLAVSSFSGASKGRHL